jgi:hypothetical protein
VSIIERDGGGGGRDRGNCRGRDIRDVEEEVESVVGRKVERKVRRKGEKKVGWDVERK